MKVVIEEQKIKYKTKKQQIIVIPKKNIKKAHQRNKIRRQIRAIMRDNNVKKYLVKYTRDNILKFKEIRDKINSYLS